MKSRAWLGLLVLLAAPAWADDFPVPGLGVRDGVLRASGPSFSVVVNAPTDDTQARAFADTLTLAGQEGEFVLHLGNLKGETERCDDALYQRRRALLETSIVPLVTIPGDNDWTDCRLPAAGGYTPFERLTRLREMFHERPNSLGRLTMPLQRQSQTSRFRGYPEQARWERDGIVFTTLNVPGTRNNYQRGAGRNGEWEERNEAIDAWLQQAFAAANRQSAQAVVIAFHADPDFGRNDEWGAPYYAFKHQLAEHAAGFKGKVLLLHAAASAVRDQPLSRGGKRLTHVTRIGVSTQQAADQWVRIEFRPADAPYYFNAQPRQRGEPGN